MDIKLKKKELMDKFHEYSKLFPNESFEDFIVEYYERKIAIDIDINERQKNLVHDFFKLYWDCVKSKKDAIPISDIREVIRS